MAALNQSVRSLRRIPDQPPVISPVPQGVDRPLWSVMIPVFNCAGYLGETLKSVLSQDAGPDVMQIEVVDDGSTDADVAAMVWSVSRGRISYYRQSENVGSLRNFQTCLERSRGHLIHILHGDDLIRDGFYSRMKNLFKQNPSIGAGFCRFAYINVKGRVVLQQQPEMENEGVLSDWLHRLCERQRIQYVAMVVRREAYESLGGFYGVEYGEDWEMWVRIAANYPVGYIPDILAEYRRHDNSISAKSFVTGKNMADLECVMNRIAGHLPLEDRAGILKTSRKFYAHYAIRVANALWSRLKHKEGASAQALAAWNMSKDVGLLLKIIRLYTRITLNI